ncbi:MAG: hypothetical protein ACI81R_002727 [Bradymonadia bacterium]|jgi:hypothetical protein
MRRLTPAQLVSLSWVVCGVLLCAATIARAAVHRSPFDALVPSLDTEGLEREVPLAEDLLEGSADALAGEVLSATEEPAEPLPELAVESPQALESFAVLRFLTPPEPLTREDESLLNAIAQAGAIEAARDEDVAEENVVIAADRIEPLSTQEQGGCRVRTNRALMARGVHRREPTRTEGPFLADGFPVVAYFDTQNLTERHQRLIVQWIHEPSGAVERHGIVAGQSHRWRNWIEKPLPLSHIGPWRIELLDADRCLVETVQFTLEAPEW